MAIAIVTLAITHSGFGGPPAFDAPDLEMPNPSGDFRRSMANCKSSTCGNVFSTAALPKNGEPRVILWQSGCALAVCVCVCVCVCVSQ